MMDINILQWKYKRRAPGVYFQNRGSWIIWKLLILLSVCLVQVDPISQSCHQSMDVCSSVKVDFLSVKQPQKKSDGQMRVVNSTCDCKPLLNVKTAIDMPQQHHFASHSAINENISGPPLTNPVVDTLEEEKTLNNVAALSDTASTSLHDRDSENVNINCSGIHHNFTLVTALINLHRENWNHFQRSFDHYLYYSIQLLHMNAPLVIYVEPHAVPFVQFHRQGREHKTKIVPTSIENLEYYRNVSKIRDIMNSEDFKTDHPFAHHPEGFSAEYNILMNSKFSMLSQAADQNVFDSSHFYWVDMAYGHGDGSVFPDQCDWEPANLMYNTSLADKITYIAINNMSLLTNIFQIYKQNIPPFLSGGFFGGSIKAVVDYYHIHKNMFRLFLQHNMIDDDQTLAILCYFEDTTLFHFVHGWWFDAFKLFH